MTTIVVIVVIILGIVSIAQSITIIRVCRILDRHRHDLATMRAWAVGREVGRSWRR